MATKKTLNAANLEALGAPRLAELLIEISTGSAAAKRRLRLELAGAQSPAEIAREVRKRLGSIARSRTFVDWQRRKALVEDLELQKRAIVEHIAKDDPHEALELMWQFMATAAPVLNRCGDSSGKIDGIFSDACDALGELATAAKVDPNSLADRAFAALQDDGYGVFDDLIAVLAPALGKEGLERLKSRFNALASEPVEQPAGERRVIGWAASGPLYADQVAASARDRLVRSVLMQIADAEGDVDAFISQYDEETQKVPNIAAEIARRLLASGRAEEALQAIEATVHRRGGWDWPDFDWEDARIEVLEALDRKDDAQAARWSCFERSLSASHLRDFLKRLPDFDDMEAEERALEYAESRKSVLTALSFLVGWPALDRAARLVLQRADQLDGDHYEILTPAAEALAGKHPLAATLLLRAMIDFSLTQARSTRNRHATRHLMECESLASSIADFAPFETHEAYAARLKREHGRKSSFWSDTS
jgi:hypothetical protein